MHTDLLHQVSLLTIEDQMDLVKTIWDGIANHIHLHQIIIVMAWLFPSLSSAEVSFVCPETVSISSGTVNSEAIYNGFEAIISKAPIRLSGAICLTARQNKVLPSCLTQKKLRSKA